MKHTSSYHVHHYQHHEQTLRSKRKKKLGTFEVVNEKGRHFKGTGKCMPNDRGTEQKPSRKATRQAGALRLALPPLDDASGQKPLSGGATFDGDPAHARPCCPAFRSPARGHGLRRILLYLLPSTSGSAMMRPVRSCSESPKWEASILNNEQ